MISTYIATSSEGPPVRTVLGVLSPSIRDGVGSVDSWHCLVGARLFLLALQGPRPRASEKVAPHWTASDSKRERFG